MTIQSATESALSNRLHSVPPAKRPESDDELRSIDDEALAGPDGPPPRRLTPEWVAVNLMDITAHLMAAIDKAAGPLERLADAAEDTTAHVAHASRFFRRPIMILALPFILGASIFATYELAIRGHSDAVGRYEAFATESPSEIRLG